MVGAAGTNPSWPTKAGRCMPPTLSTPDAVKGQLLAGRGCAETPGRSMFVPAEGSPARARRQMDRCRDRASMAICSTSSANGAWPWPTSRDVAEEARISQRCRILEPERTLLASRQSTVSASSGSRATALRHIAADQAEPSSKQFPQTRHYDFHETGKPALPALLLSAGRA